MVYIEHGAQCFSLDVSGYYEWCFAAALCDFFTDYFVICIPTCSSLSFMSGVQVVLFTINAQGQWAVLHGNPMVTFVCATDEVEDVIERYGRRRYARHPKMHNRSV